jgi:hypothetical protein
VVRSREHGEERVLAERPQEPHAGGVERGAVRVRHRTVELHDHVPLLPLR